MLSAAKLFHPDDYDLDGLRRMLASEKLEEVTADDVFDYFSGDDDKYTSLLIDGLRDSNPQRVGIALIAALKDYFYDLTTEEDAVDAARELHQDAYDNAVIARGETE